ncbi:MAG TPA: PLP-dependent aminotransferase family protein [Solirubrobacterales bacterium]|nr:PLP-dependent aminotransferase family protein [Solirubrobacterales bacterium]
MTESGTTSPASPELLLPDWDPAAPRRAQLEAGLRDSIRAGRLRPDVRLPSSRALAAELGVSRRLVVETYEQLAAEGYLIAARGSGTRVAPATRSSPAAPAATEDGTVAAAVAATGASAAAAVSAAAGAPGIDLFPGAPDLSLFPRRAWGRAQRRALAELPDARLGYGEYAGAAELRDALAEHLGRVRAAAVGPARVVVTAGYQQGLRVFCELLRGRGARRVAVEDPGYPVATWTIESTGLELVPLPVDDDGLDIGALTGADPDAVVVTPAHSVPVGAVLAAERRLALVEWARGRGALVLEDDYDAELRYDRRGPAGTLQGLAPDVVVLAGSVSKTLAPALRLGWLCLPAELVAAATIARGTLDGGGPRLEELALADLIASGAFDRHLRAARARYREKRAALLEAIAAALPAARVRGIDAGLHLLLELPAGVEEADVVGRAAAAGVRVQGLADFTRAHPQPPALVLGYGLPTVRELREAVAVIAEACTVAAAA